MTEDEKMFHIGLWMLGAVLLLTIALQVCYRTQNRARDRVRREIVETQQKTAELKANFSSFVRPEILRNLVVSIYPKAEVVGFHKYIAINDLPIME
ncbi:hypothetical protein HDR66_03635 [bacterium]|nr:hypothetical protein [bacterium]